MFIIKEEEDLKDFQRCSASLLRGFNLELVVVDTGKMFLCDIQAQEKKR